MVILGYPQGGRSGSLQTLLERVADEERHLGADAFQAAVNTVARSWCRVASTPATAASGRW